MRRTLSAADAKARFADALRQAEGGDLVVITRYGKPAAALVGADRLDLLERLAAEEPVAAVTAVTATVDDAAAGEPTAEQLLERAAAASLRRMDDDLEKLPESLRPVLRLIRGSLFQRRLTVERIKATLGVGAHDVTTRFCRAVGATIRRYLEDRRLECACRLLLDTDLGVPQIGQLVGYHGSEAFSRAFKRRYGQRPRIYREFEGRLSPRAASEPGSEARK